MNKSKFTYVDISEIVSNFWNQKKLIIKFTLIFFVLGFVIALLSKPRYTSTSVFTPNLSKSTSISSTGLGGLAAMAGINLDKINNEDGNVSPILYPEIFYSLPFQIKIIETKLNFSNYSDSISYEEFITSKTSFNPISSLRKFISSKISKSVLGIEKSKAIGISNEKYYVIKKLIDDLRIDLNSKEGSIYISATLSDPVAAAEMAMTAQLILQNFVIDFKIKKAKDELLYLEKRLLEKEKAFREIQNKIANYKDKNQNFSSELAQSRLKFLESEYDLAYKIYSDISTQLESKKLQVKEDTPLFTTLKPASIPNEKSNISRLSILIIFTIVGFALSLLSIIYKDSLKKIIKIFSSN